MGRAARPPKPPAAAAPKRGGARAGAGRKREKLPADVLVKLGPPPIEGGTKAVREWNGKLLALLQWESLNGRVSADLAASIRANAGSLDRALPELPRSPVGGDDDEDADDDDGDGERVQVEDATPGAAGGELRVG